MLDIINRRVSYKSVEVISELYRSYVIPHLEYCTQYWSQINVKVADMLEAVQKRAIKMISCLRNLHEERLKRLDIFSLRHRKIKGYMREVFKMIHDIGKVNLRKLFCIDEDGRTRNNHLCLKIKRRVNSNIGLNFFP